MTFPDVEIAINKHLSPLKNSLGISIGGLPERAKQYGEPKGNGWMSLQWVETKLVNYSIGQQSFTFEVDYKLGIRVLDLRKRMYNSINEARRLLLGFPPPSCYQPIEWMGSKFYGYEDGKFWWFAECYFRAFVIGKNEQQFINYDDAEKFPVLQTVNICKMEV